MIKKSIQTKSTTSINNKHITKYKQAIFTNSLQIKLKSKGLAVKEDTHDLVHWQHCKTCGLVYNVDDPLDYLKHREYHDIQVNGLKWPNKCISKKITMTINDLHKHTPKFNRENDILNLLLSKKKQTEISTNKESKAWSSTHELPIHKRLGAGVLCSEKEFIIEINPKRQNEVNLALQVMKIVNEELNAPQDENNFWATLNSRNESTGKCFIYIRDNHAIGVITIEDLTRVEHKMKWMIYSNKQIIEHVNPTFKCGVSRIWVCKKYRRFGIASSLLNTALTNTLSDGKASVNKYQLAWSQPSERDRKSVV
ncbi:related to N-acetyltransferase ECO1 [Saccharomycodes ludwigii]|uniref:N-acetyltransferase ECO1 n=1 Tax=Saccharomycodes ludwigii TaxID=36035 RepID=A0A376B8Y9_9ASCO|nr:related to N-acetyltransferase ECO1 [Saccharomycodes ludwigii]